MQILVENIYELLAKVVYRIDADLLEQDDDYLKFYCACFIPSSCGVGGVCGKEENVPRLSWVRFVRVYVGREAEAGSPRCRSGGRQEQICVQV